MGGSQMEGIVGADENGRNQRVALVHDSSEPRAHCRITGRCEDRSTGKIVFQGSLATQIFFCKIV